MISGQVLAADGACPHCTTHGENEVQTGPWLAAADRQPLLDFALFTAEGGQTVTGADLTGQPPLMAFIYTRCANPLRCARMAQSLAAIHAYLGTTPMAGRCRIVLGSFDPTYDTPELVRAFAVRHGLPAAEAVLSLVPDPMTLADLVEAQVIQAQWQGDQVSLHGSQLLVLDAQARLARIYSTAAPPVEAVAADVQTLLGEMTSP